VAAEETLLKRFKTVLKRETTKDLFKTSLKELFKR
jgi:hypothetical protein